MKRVMIMASVALLASCGGDGNKSSVPAIDTTNFDRSVALEDDFYEHATGGWQKKNPLRPEHARYGAFDVLRENNEVRIRDLFAELEKQQAETGSVEQKIGDLYKLGLDSSRLNAEGATPVREELAAIEKVSGRDGYSRLLASMHFNTAAPFFAPYVEADMMNSSMNMLYLYQAGLGMGNRDYYLDAENEAIRTSYRSYITQLFALAGYTPDEAEAAADAVLRIETEIAKASYSNVELRDPYKNYHKVSIEELKKSYGAIDWDLYFEGLGIRPTEVNVGQPSQLEAVNRLLESASDRELKYYLVFHDLNSAAPYLSDDFAATRFDFYGRTLSGQQEQKPRWKRALAVPNNILSEAVGEMYVAKYFPEENKTRMLEMVKNLQQALGKHISSLEWMSDSTKAKALEKLDAFYVKIGYPDKWKDYSALTIDPTLSWWENIKRANAWESADQLAEVGKPVDRDKWYMSPQTVNAYYNPTTNEICFPAAILQPPFFNMEADDAVNYGAIGVVIGHEMTHGFDDQGRQFDKEGNLNDWWTAADAEAFKSRADRLVEQFNAIVVVDSMHANGQLTLGENIADQGGLRVAYTAMKQAQNGNEPAPIDGFSADQRFYLAYATLWAQNIRDEEIARLTKLDPHSLGKWRVNATLRNIDTFFQAFGIEKGKMFLAPEERVVIW